MFADNLMSERAINFEIRKIIAPLVKNEINDFLTSTSTVSDLIKSYFHTDEFKRKQLWELEKRVAEIKEELGEADYN